MKNKFAFLLCALLLSSCGNKNSSLSFTENFNDIGFQFFNNRDDRVEIVFFDSDNIVDSEDGYSFKRSYLMNGSKSINSCESYLIKYGNTEILVDAGYQTQKPSVQEQYPYKFVNENISASCNDNLLRKITSYCTDGILDYLIVTHADMDHIGSLVVENGVIDAFLNKKTITNVNGAAVTLKEITHFIDFDSGVVALHSYLELSKEKRLVDSDIYPTYIAKKEALIEFGTNYLPAAAFFSDKIFTNNGISMSLENKNIGRPSDYLRKDDSQLVSEILSTDSAKDYVDKVKKNAEYANCVLKTGGELVDNNGKFYFSIPINNAKLNILYNWFYDFGERHGFNSQDRNNISVCFSFTLDDFKFLSFGDLGGRGENGILNYYSDCNLLENVTCFKSSHHGSTQNGENSLKLFKIIRPKIISIIGCAQSTIDAQGMNPAAAFVKQQFLDNVCTAFDDNNDFEPYIFYTNISCYRFDEVKGITVFESLPFYGDIKISYKNNNVDLSHSFIGKIKAYMSQELNTNYKKNYNEEYFFRTRENNKFISFQKCDWFNRIGLIYGGV